MQGQGPGPRYGHVMDLVAQRYLVTVSGNDGEAISLFDNLRYIFCFCFSFFVFFRKLNWKEFLDCC